MVGVAKVRKVQKVRGCEVVTVWAAVATRRVSRFGFPNPNFTTEIEGKVAGSVTSKFVGRLETKFEGGNVK